MKSKLANYIPDNSREYCLDQCDQYDFDLKIVKNRSSKSGDYKYSTKSKKHIITINKDLNPYTFLLTFIHELAHLKANLDYGRKIKPHGKEWKTCFTDLAKPLLIADIFPLEILSALNNYFVNPKASTFSDDVLVEILRKYDKHTDGLVNLSQIIHDAEFTLRHREFIKGVKKRTRYVCKDVLTRKNYLISGIVRVKEDGLTKS